MDIDAYYREQDKRMNLPDESIDDYLKRVGAQRIPCEARKVSEHQEDRSYILQEDDTHKFVAAATSSAAFQEAQDMMVSGVQEPVVAAVKQRPYSSRYPYSSCNGPGALDLRSSFDSQVPQEEELDVRVPIPTPTPTKNKNHMQEILDPACPNPVGSDGNRPLSRERKGTASEREGLSVFSASVNRLSGTFDSRRKSVELVHATGSSILSPALDISKVTQEALSYEDISHFTDDGTPRRVYHSPGPPSLKDQAPNQKLKRQASQDAEPANYRKKRAATPSVEDITTFDASLVIEREKSALPAVALQAGRKPKAPALNMKPIRPPIINATNNASAAASNPSNQDPTPIIIDDDEPQPAPRNIYLEVKQRVAHYAAAKERDRVAKLASKRHHPKSDDAANDPGASSSSSPKLGPKSEAPNNISTKAPQLDLSKTDKSKGKAKARVGARGAKGKNKEKPPQMTPTEYAEKLCDGVKEKMAAASKEDLVKMQRPSRFLCGMNIFYTGGDMHFATERTRGRMDLIVRYGGNLVPQYDASVVTYIITDAQIRPTLRALGVKRLSDIPNHIPTITWGWVASAIGRAPILTREGLLKVRMDELFMHAAFHERFDAGPVPEPRAVRKGLADVGKGKGKVGDEDIGDFSRISDFTQDKSRLPASGQELVENTDKDKDTGSTSNVAPVHLNKASNTTDDPLAEFYAKARADRDTRWSRHGEVDDSDANISEFDVEEPVPAAVVIPKKRGWTCDGRAAQQQQSCPNQDIVDKLEELKGLHQAKVGDEDRWRVFTYTKCIRALRYHPKRISTLAEARALRGVGGKTAEKIMEIIETGDLRRIGYENTEGVQVTKLFQGVYGVGQSTAYQWYAAGCRSLADVLAGMGGVTLTPAQKIGIEFYDDINDRMPREEAREIFELIKTVALRTDSQLFIEIMGSYRRGKADCGDIDIMITRDPKDGKTHKGVLSQLLEQLHAAGILTEDLACPEDPDDLEAIYRGLCRIPGRKGARRRRIDFLTVPWASKGAALLYYTGDDIFNRAIRMKASVLGYSLNQRGLFGGVVRDPRDRRKLNTGTIIASETEEEIFKILNVPWQEPHERVRG